MRYVLAENAWELLIATILLVFVLGIAFTVFNKYKCKARISSSMQVAEAIKNTLLEIQQTKQPYFSQTIDLSQLNSTQCSINVRCTGYEVTIDVNCGYCGSDNLTFPYNIPCSGVAIVPGVKSLTIIYSGNRVMFYLS